MKKLLFSAITIILIILSQSAIAQTKLIEDKNNQGYGYEFGDDPLAAGGFGPNDATIRVRPGPVRTTLIRPRIQFVDQMLKSVERL